MNKLEITLALLPICLVIAVAIKKILTPKPVKLKVVKSKQKRRKRNK